MSYFAACAGQRVRPRHRQDPGHLAHAQQGPSPMPSFEPHKLPAPQTSKWPNTFCCFHYLPPPYILACTLRCNYVATSLTRRPRLAQGIKHSIIEEENRRLQKSSKTSKD